MDDDDEEELMEMLAGGEEGGADDGEDEDDDDDDAEDEDDADDDAEDEDALLAADLAGDAGGAKSKAEGGKAADEDDDEDEDGDEADGDGGAEAGEDADGADPEAAKAAPKRRGRPKDPNMPKRPPNPYQQHTTAERARLKEANSDLLKDLKATGKAFAESWQLVPKATQEAMQAEYDKNKADWDVKMAAYKLTDGFKEFQKELKLWMDMKAMKKLIKKQKAVTPARPKSGYMAFAGTVREDIQKANPGLSPGETSKKIAERWQALPAKETEKFQAEASVAKEKYIAEMIVFKRSEQYRDCVDEQMALELKQGLKRLKDEYADKIPGRPCAPFQLWATSACLKGTLAERSKQFQALPQEQQKEWQDKSEKAKVVANEAKAAFFASKDGLKMTKSQHILKKKIALSGARKKFLVDAPRRPLSAQALCALGDVPERSGKWSSLSAENQKFWEEERERRLAEYERKMEEFKQTDSWKQFERATTIGLGSRRGTGRGKGGGRGQGGRGGRGNDGKGAANPKAKAKAKAEPPDSMPKKPKDARRLWMKGQVGAGMSLGEMGRKWNELGEEGQKPFKEQADAAFKAYTAELEAWGRSKDGKKYARAQDAKKQKAKEQRAREKHLSGADAPQEPVKPKSAQVVFFDEKRAELQKAEPALGAPCMAKELQRRLIALWAGLDEEGRKAYDSKLKSLLEVYEFELQAYKETPAYKKFEKAAGKSQGGRGKRSRGDMEGSGGRGRGRGRGRGGKKEKDELDALFSDSDAMGDDSDELGLGSDDD